MSMCLPTITIGNHIFSFSCYVPNTSLSSEISRERSRVFLFFSYSPLLVSLSWEGGRKKKTTQHKLLKYSKMSSYWHSLKLINKFTSILKVRWNFSSGCGFLYRMWNSALFSLPEHASIWRMYFRIEETEMIKLNKLDIIPCISGMWLLGRCFGLWAESMGWNWYQTWFPWVLTFFQW